MEREVKVKRFKTSHKNYDGNNEDYVFTQQTFNSTMFADSRVKIETRDRGQLTDKPSRDLSIEFYRVSEGGRMVGGQVSFLDGAEVKVLLDFLKDKFNEDGTRRVD